MTVPYNAQFQGSSSTACHCGKRCHNCRGMFQVSTIKYKGFPSTWITFNNRRLHTFFYISNIVSYSELRLPVWLETQKIWEMKPNDYPFSRPAQGTSINLDHSLNAKNMNCHAEEGLKDPATTTVRRVASPGVPATGIAVYALPVHTVRTA